MPTTTASEALAPWLVLNCPPQNLIKYYITVMNEKIMSPKHLS